MSWDLKPYPSYKDSGVKWLGDVPDHWEVRRLKHAFCRIVGGSTPSSAEQAYWDGEIVWVTPVDVSRAEWLMNSSRKITCEGRAACSAELVPSGSIIVTSRAPVGNAAIAAVDLCTNQGCKALIPQVKVIEARFGFAVVQVLKSELRSLATGTTFTEISTAKMGTVSIAVPSIAEQAVIIRFLDYMDRRIRRYIRAKQKLIALLNEQKQAIIQRVVTRGLDPDVRLKSSGVEWLGDVPEHWEVAALRLRYSQCLGKMLDSKRISGAYLFPYLRNVDVQWDWINTESLQEMDIAPHEYERYTLRLGDLLVCEGGEVGRSAIWNGELSSCGFQKALHRLRPVSSERDLPRFLLYALRVASKAGAFNDGHQSTIAHLTGDKLRSHRFAFPPRAEQAAIVECLDHETSCLDRAIAVTNREIDLLREYRTRLIADVVMGKVDVREVAAQLPEETEKVDPSVETDALVKGDEEDEVAGLDSTEEEVEA